MLVELEGEKKGEVIEGINKELSESDCKKHSANESKRVWMGANSKEHNSRQQKLIAKGFGKDGNEDWKWRTVMAINDDGSSGSTMTRRGYF